MRIELLGAQPQSPVAAECEDSQVAGGREEEERRKKEGGVQGRRGG